MNTVAWDDVVYKVSQDDANKYDMDYVETRDMSMDERTGLVHIKKKKYSLTDHSSGQVCRHFNIPKAFWKNILDNEARAYLFNKFSYEINTAYYLRCRKGQGGNPDTMRAVLSDRFVPLDNRFILEQLKTFFDQNKSDIVNFDLNDWSMHFRFIMNDKVLDLSNGHPDVLNAGVHLSNSEVGLMSTNIDAMVFRQVCSNGAILKFEDKSFLKQAHQGYPEENFAEAYKESIWDAVEYARIAYKNIKKSKDIVIKKDEDIDKRFIPLEKSKKYTDDFINSMRNDFKKSDRTLYDLFNVMTEKSQELSWDKRINLEKIAGTLLFS